MNIVDQIKKGSFADPATLPGAILYAVAFTFLAWLLGHALRVAVERMLARDKQNHVDRMAVKFLAKLFRYCVYIFALIAYAHFVPGLSGLGAASLAGISVLTVIVGLAAQNTLGNLVAGLSLLLYRPFKLGDRLQVVAPTGLETGFVENLTLGYTLLRTDDNRRVVVPNSLMASQTAINLTATDSRVVCSVSISIGCVSHIDAARSILLALAGKHPKAKEVCGCPLTQVSNAGVVLTLDVWCADALTAITLRCDLLEQALKRFAEEGIKIPFTQSLVVLKDERGGAEKPDDARPAQDRPPGDLHREGSDIFRPPPAAASSLEKSKS
jgi:small-conductance mechanosensitive channel